MPHSPWQKSDDPVTKTGPNDGSVSVSDDETVAVQWSVRGLFVITLIVGVVMGVWVQFGAVLGIAVSFFAILCIAHILGAWLGHHTTAINDDRRSRVMAARAAETTPLDVADSDRPEASSHVPAPLSHSLGISIGAIVGVVAGGGALVFLYADELKWGNVLVAIVATATIGGLAGFGIWSFVSTCLTQFRARSRNGF